MLSIIKCISLYLIYFALGSVLASAQTAQPVFRHYSTSHGLPSPEVYDIIQDREGYIWFSTDNGVSRFNGYTFENFGPDQGLNNNVVFYLQEDQKGRIWMSTMSGNIYYYERDRIYPYRFNSILQEYKTKYQTHTETYLDTLGTMHVAIVELGYLQIDSTGGTTLISDQLPCTSTLYEVEGRILNNYIQPKNKVDSLDKISCDSFDIAEGHYPLAIYRDTGIQLIALPHPHASAIKSRGQGVWLDNDRYLFVIPSRAYFIEQGQVKQHAYYPYEINSYWKEDKELFLGNEGGGSSKYAIVEDLMNGNFEHILREFTVSHILRDEANGYWFSTTENGVFYAPPNQDYRILNATSGLSTDNITALSFKNDQELFIGLKDGAVFHWKQSEKQLTQLPKSAQDQEVYQLTWDPMHQELWKGSKQLQVFREDKWHPSIWIKNGKSITNRANKQFNIYPEEDLLVGCNSGDGGIAVLQMSNTTINAIPRSAFGRSFTVFKDFEDRIWVGRINGLFEFVSDTLIRPDLPSDLLLLRVESIQQLKDSTLIIASKGGGVLLWKDDYFRQINTSDGLTSNMIENIHVDENQTIWAGTLNGLNNIQRIEDRFLITTYDVTSGLPSNEINAIDSRGDQLWVGTTKGLIKISGTTQKASQTPPPRIEYIIVNGKEMSVEHLNDLPYNKNNLKISFLTLNYKLNGKIPYRYRTGSTDAWNYTHYRTVDYNSLAPGSYLFEVQSQNEDGVWSPSSNLAFIIRAPYWQTFWFWLIVLTITALLVLLYYQNRIDQLRKAAWMEREINALKQSALRAQMNPHFIFNCLNSIQRTIINGDRIRGADYLAYFAQLIRLIMDSMTMEKISLAHEIQILENYLELEKMRTKDKFSYDILIEDTIELKEIYVPPLLVQPYVENAIIHGLIDAKGAGKITIEYKKEQEQLVIQVTDNGIGITESKRRKEGQHKLHRSVGMSIPVKRLKLLDPEASYDKIKIDELRDSTGKVVGTQVNIRLPLARLYHQFT